MNRKEVLMKLAAIANILDAKGEYKSASALTDVMRKVSQSNPWWQNEAGEPMYSPESIRAEESTFSNEHNDDDYDDSRKERQSERFEGVFENWASHQNDLSLLQQKFDTDLKDVLEQYILGPNSKHQNTWWDGIDTMHDILDATKNAILSGADIMQAINSIPAETKQNRNYIGPEDLGWDGGFEN